jgi:hypothetical protein
MSMFSAKDRAIKEARTNITEAYYRLDSYTNDPIVQRIRDGLRAADKVATDYLNNRAFDRMADAGMRAATNKEEA